MAKSETKNDKAWRVLFEHFSIVEKVESVGYFDITATQIRQVGKREARLMCKFDFEQSVAKPFKDHALSILAINNGSYRIAQTSPFFAIDLESLVDVPVQELALPDHLETLKFDNITNESQALDAATASGMLADLLGEDTHLTVRGRRYCSRFEINLPSSDGSVTYPVESVQIEVDGGYEGMKVLALIEAKMGSADNMNMRQLIYPHAHFTSYLKKPVQTYVMFYETGSVFTFIPMLWDGVAPELRYADAVRYQLVSPPKSKLKTSQLPKGQIDYSAPSPQADDFAKILFGLGRLSEIQPTTKEELFSAFPIVPRQYDYYFNAMRWLGLAKRQEQGACQLTEFGEDLLEVSEAERIRAIRQQLLTDSVFENLLSDPGYMATEEEMARWKVNETTYKRRRSTANAWLQATEELPLDS